MIANGFVSMSAIMSSVRQCNTYISPDFINWFTKLFLIWMWRALSDVDIPLFTMWITAVLSSYKVIGLDVSS